MNNNEILERIKKIRNLRGVKQKYIALQMGMSQSTYSKIENGNQKLTFEVIEKIADVLNIPINHLTQKEIQIIL
jgi:transcriptional regulator